MMKTKGLLVVISGFSGAGKGSLIRELRKRYDNYRLSVSATTRQPRTVDIPGETYFFLTRDEFEKMISGNGFLEYAQYNNNYYGTPRAYVEQQLQEGRDVLLEIEVQGAMKIRQQFPDAMLIFIVPPSAEILEKRLIGRGTETEEQVRARLRLAVEESRQMPEYDYIVINDDLGKACEELHTLIDGQHRRYALNREFVEQLQEDLYRRFKEE